MAAVCLLACACATQAQAPDAATTLQGIDLLDVPALISPKATRSLLLGVHAAGDRIVAVGERGIVLVSGDAGTTWQQAQVPLSVSLTSVFLNSPERGWVAGHDGVLLN